mmetsp:Transcript_22088/g.54589  ORF Transcript_22088/g.54589 Transcript_22088/m.54589 type:complete len:100 (-) Transcript_22088:150-449(-)
MVEMEQVLLHLFLGCCCTCIDSGKTLDRNAFKKLVSKGFGNEVHCNKNHSREFMLPCLSSFSIRTIEDDSRISRAASRILHHQEYGAVEESFIMKAARL